MATYDAIPRVVDVAGTEIYKKAFLLVDEYHLFYVAGILNAMDMNGQIYGLSILIMGSKVNCLELM